MHMPIAFSFVCSKHVTVWSCCCICQDQEQARSTSGFLHLMPMCSNGPTVPLESRRSKGVAWLPVHISCCVLTLIYRYDSGGKGENEMIKGPMSHTRLWACKVSCSHLCLTTFAGGRGPYFYWCYFYWCTQLPMQGSLLPCFQCARGSNWKIKCCIGNCGDAQEAFFYSDELGQVWATDLGWPCTLFTLLLNHTRACLLEATVQWQRCNALI